MAITPISVDAETDGPAQGIHSVVWFGAVLVDDKLKTEFEGKMCPIGMEYEPDALKTCGLTREETLHFPSPLLIMPQFVSWVRHYTKPGTIPRLYSDSNSFDAGFLNHYFWKYAGENPFGHTSVNFKNLYQGVMMGRAAAGLEDPKYIRRSFKHLVKTPHDHNPVHDARGNAEAMLAARAYGVEISV